MSQNTVRALRGNIEFSFTLLEKFIQVCPEKIWRQPFGKWPVAQQIFHTLTSSDFFIRSPKGEPLPTPCPKAGDLSEIAKVLPSQEQTLEFLATVKTAIGGFIDSLNDDALTRNNEGLSQRMGRHVTNAETIMLLSAHTLYHLGAGDAALREQGLEGVF